MALATIEPSVHARHVIGMALQARGFVQHAQRLPAQIQQLVGDHHARRERRRARSHAFAERNLVADFQLDGRHRHAVAVGHRDAPSARSGCPAPPGDATRHRGPDPQMRQRLAAPEAARQVHAQREPQCIETRAPGWRSRPAPGR